MSYMRTSESGSPAPASQYFDSATEGGDFEVELEAAQCIGNPTDTAGYITFKRPGNTHAERDYFEGGQTKPWVVETVYGNDGGTSGLSGSTCRAMVSGGINGVGDILSTTTTTGGA